MNRSEIIASFKEKYDDEFSINVFTRFVEEFLICFGQYITAEELIKRIKENAINNIEICSEYIEGKRGKLDGQYKDGKIRLYKGVLENDQLCGYLAFHELIHVTTSQYLEDGTELLGFSHISAAIGIGLNEAMTEWMTRIRNEKLGINLESGYEGVVQQIMILLKIVGEDKLIQCFLYNPEQLDSLLAAKNIKYESIESGFRELTGRDGEIIRLKKEQKLEDVENYGLYKEIEKIFETFCTSLGKIDSIEAFRKKYQILTSYTDPDFDMNSIIEYRFYKELFKDVWSLSNHAIQQGDINTVLDEFEFSPIKYRLYLNLAQKLKGDKNEMVKYLYSLYETNQEEYNYLVIRNYGLLYDFFSETRLKPQEEVLYDMEKYAMIGKFLKEHDDYEYDEITYYKYVCSNDTMVYRFITLDGKQYLYTIPNIPVERQGDTEFKLTFKDSVLKIFLGDKERFESEAKNVNPPTMKNIYYAYSQIDDLEYMTNLENVGEDLKNQYKARLEKLKTKVEKNKTEDPKPI